MSEPRKKIDRKLKNTEKLGQESDVIRQARLDAEETRSNAKETEKLKVEYDNKILDYKKLSSQIEEFKKKYGEKVNLKDFIAEDGESYLLANPEMHSLLDFYLSTTYNDSAKFHISSSKNIKKEQLMQEVRSLNFKNFIIFIKNLKILENYENKLDSDDVTKYKKSWDLIVSLKDKMVSLKLFGNNAEKLVNEFIHPKIREAAKTFFIQEVDLVRELNEIISIVFKANKVADEIYQMSHPSITQAISTNKFKCEGDEENNNIKVIAGLAGEESTDAPLVLTASSDSYFYYMHGVRQCEFQNLLKNKKNEAYAKYIVSQTKILTECSKLRVAESNKNYDEQGKAITSSSTSVSTIVVKDQAMCDQLDVRMQNMLDNLSILYPYNTTADIDIAEKLKSIDYFVNFDGEGDITIGSESLVSHSVQSEGLHKDFSATLAVYEEAVTQEGKPLSDLNKLLTSVVLEHLMIENGSADQTGNENDSVSETISSDPIVTSVIGENAITDHSEVAF